MGARSPWDPLHQPFPHTGVAGGFREGIPPVPLHPGSSPSPAQHRVALSYFYFYILLFLFLFFPFKPTQQPTIPTPLPHQKKKKAAKTAISALPTPHSPNAFMYSSKLAVSTSFQVPTNASTMAKPRVSPCPSVPAAPHRPQLPPGPAAP